MRRAFAQLLAVLIAVAFVAPLGPAPALAQDPSLAPKLGSVVVEQALTQPGIFDQDFCPTGRNQAQFVPEGYLLRVTGPCTPNAPTALISQDSRRLRVSDGGVEVEARVTAGSERAYLALEARVQENGDSYALVWYPSGGTAALRRLATSGSTTLAQQVDLPVPAPGAWTRLALRFNGSEIWAFLDDRPVLTAVDDSFGPGAVVLTAVRFPRDAEDELDPADEEEVAVLWRNFRVSALESGDAARAPIYRPSGQPAPGAAGIVPAAGTPPGVGATVLEAPLTQPGVIPTAACRNGKASSVIVGEGHMFKARGKCSESAAGVGVGLPVPGLVVPDGEIRFDVKVANGRDRAWILVSTRAQRDGGYVYSLVPDIGLAAIERVQRGDRTTLARRTDLNSLLADEWSTVAIRQRGSELWLLVNEVPVLKAEDATHASGIVGLVVERLDDEDEPTDEQEVAVVFRNLRVSAVEGVPDDRRPTYRQP